MSDARSNWSSKTGMILAATGSAVGLGAIWKFPYMAGANGGSAFIIPFILMVLFFGVTLILAEIIIGRAGRGSSVTSFRRIGGKFWAPLGFVGVLCAFLIMTYYSTVGGWCLTYLFEAIMGNAASSDLAMLEKTFLKTVSTPVSAILYQTLFLAITAGVLIFGVNKGIERISKVLMPLLFVLMIVLPVVSFAFFALLFNQGAIRNIPIAVLDQDNTTLSRKAVQMIDDTPTAMVAYGIQGMDEGERLMREGRIMAIVQIPAFFEKNILSNSQTRLENYVSGTNITVNGLLSKDIQTAVTTFTAGIQLQVLMKQGLTQRQAMAQLMPVRFDKHVLFNPHINYGYYLSPSFMPMMLMIFVVMVTVFAIGTELKHATAREWLGTGNGSVAAALAGKVLPITAVMFLISLVMLVINFKIVGTPLNGSLAVILAGTLLFILSYQSISVLIVSLLANLRLSLSIGGGYSVLAFTFSGLTFPIMAMWEPMQWVSKIFPFTFYTDIFVDQMLRGTPWVYSLPDLCYMSLFIVLPLLCLPRLKRVCTEEKFWGRL